MRLSLIPLLIVSTQHLWAQESARIYVYALRETPARSWLPISSDGVAVAKIKRGTFFAINATAGRHMLSGKGGVPVFVDLKAGEEQFVRLDWRMQIGEPATLVLSNVPAVVARNEMRFVLYVDEKEVLSTSVFKTDPRVRPEPRLKTRDENQQQR